MLSEKDPGKGWKMTGKTLIIIILVATVAGIALTAASFYLNAAPTGTTEMSGTLYINSSGELNGAGNYTATYNATLNSKDGAGSLNLTLISGSGDLLLEHYFNVTGVVAGPYNLTLSFAGETLILPWVSNTTIWKADNESYIASWGPSAPATELLGTITPQDFPGLRSTYYVMFYLTVPSQPADDIPFVVAPYVASQDSPDPPPSG